MSIYKKMYYLLMGKMDEAIQLLIEAQKEVENIYSNAQPEKRSDRCFTIIDLPKKRLS